MQLFKTLLSLGVAACSVSASAVVPRATRGSPDVPMCTNQDPGCNIYNGVSICVPKCYRVFGIINPFPTSGSSGGVINAPNYLNGGRISGVVNDQSITFGGATGSTGSSGSSSGDGSTDTGAVSSGVTNNQTYNFGRQTAPWVTCDFNTLKCNNGKQLTGCRIRVPSANQVDESLGDSCGTTQGDGRGIGYTVPLGVSTNSTSFIAQHSSSAGSRATADVRLHAVGALLAVGALASALC